VPAAKSTRPRVVVQRLDDLVDQLRCADVDVVGHDAPPQEDDEEVCVVGADELEYFADIDMFSADKTSDGESTTTAGTGHTIVNDDSVAAEETQCLVGEVSAAGHPAAGMSLQLDLQQQHDVIDENEAALFLNTPDPANFFEFGPANKTAGSLDSTEAEKFLNDLWLESNLEAVDNWNEDNLFPDLI